MVTIRKTCYLITCILLASITFIQITQAQTYAIKDVTVISMATEGSLPHQTVVIQDGVIKRIGRSIKIPKTATLIDGTGKYLIPGLFDMHAHFYYEQGEHVNTCESEMKLMLANGLTTVRIEGGHPAYLGAREKVRRKEWIGPRLLIASPPFVGIGSTENPFEFFCDNPKDADEAVKRFKAEGYDAIKIAFMVKPDVYLAITQAAREEELKITGHVGPLIKLPAALAAGQQIEHMDEFIEALLPDTSYNHGQSVSDMNLWRPKAWATVPFLQVEKIPSLVQRIKNAGIVVTPTNYFFYSFFATGIDEDQTNQNAAFKYVPSHIKDHAWKVRAKYWDNPPPKESREKYVAIRFKLIKALWKAGVPLMTGSDSPQWFTVPGFAIHDELENLVQAGLTPYAALQTATVNPAKYLGLFDKTGTITTGKGANLVLLDSNPLEDIRNTRSINSVIINGNLFNRTELNKLLKEAEILGQ